MSRIRTSGTLPELLLRRALSNLGITYRQNPRILGMRPDIVLMAQRVAVFVDGCFWHGCPRHFKVPTKNPLFWSAKIARNRARDKRQGLKLVEAGWVVVRVWEHAVKTSASRCAARVQRAVSARVAPPATVQGACARRPGTTDGQPKSFRAPRMRPLEAKSGTRIPHTVPTLAPLHPDGQRRPSSVSPSGPRTHVAPKSRKRAVV